MAIRFYCPGCQKPLAIANRQAGTHAVCPSCQQELTIPSESSRPKPLPATPDAPPDVAPSAQAPPARPRRPRRLLLAGVAMAGVLGLAVSLSLASSREGQASEPDRDNLAQPAVDLGQEEALAQADRPPVVEDPPAPSPAEPEAASPPPDKPSDPPRAEAPVRSAPAQPPVPAGPQPMPEPAGAGPALPADAPAAQAPREGIAPAVKPAAPRPKQSPAEIVRERWANKRRSRLTDEELRVQLLLPPEVDLETAPGTTKKVVSLSSKSAGTGVDVLPLISSRRADLLGLPLRPGVLARMNQEEALNLKVLSQVLRLHLQTSMPGVVRNIVDPRPDPEILRHRLLDPGPQATWLRPQAISTLRQLLMHEHRHVRLVLVDVLSKIDGRPASLALAERAVFDLDPDVRLAALVALQGRPNTEYQAALVAGLRYPWPAAADHAAEALVALELRDAVPKLLSLLDARELSEPYPVEQGTTRRAVVPELVRVNHLRNCLMCHAYSSSPADPVRGLAPHAEHLVPLPSSGTRAASSTKSWGGGGGSAGSVVTPTFVRADITFLRQDFSVIQPVANHGRLWPADQRFDYLVRLRPLSPETLLAWQDQLRDFRSAEPQQESLLFALRELTGENPGPTAEHWKRYYSPITGKRHAQPLEPVDYVQHVRDSLIGGSPLQQAERLAALRDRTGEAYDTALVQAMPQLNGELQKLGRGVLVDRFFCLPQKRLGEKLGDPNAEVRRAAVSVCRQRKLKPLVPELIALLDDGNPEVAKQSHQTLQQFAAHDFGPRSGAGPEERRAAMEAWRGWWEKQKQTAPKGRAS